MGHFQVLSQFKFGDITVLYQCCESRSRVQLCLVPSAKVDELVAHRAWIPKTRTELSGLKWLNLKGSEIDSLIQIKLGETPSAGGFNHGVTMRDSPDTYELKYEEQTVVEDSGTTTIITRLRHEDLGFTCEHSLSYREGEQGLRVRSAFLNTTDAPLTLELISSFVLGGITPFDDGEAQGRLRMHRFRSWWSAEGRHESMDIEDLHMERSWSGCGKPVERFGQLGSMPVRKFFPFVALEDYKAGVIWGAQLAYNGSWQMQVTRRDDCFTLDGGLADREFGHWMKTVPPGERFESPEALLSTVAADQIGTLCQRLTAMHKPPIESLPPSEQDMPVIFNEWCTSWGSPNHENILALAKRLQGTGVRYLVIDDGWAKRPPEARMQSNGDWDLDTDKFPDLPDTLRKLREMGFIPGIWFEFEVCNPGSKAFALTEHHLTRDGRILQVGGRRFWDFRDPWVSDYLSKKVIHFLKDNGFGYLKVDYNDSLGLGVDSEDGLGEGLRQHLVAVQFFFRKLREEIPDLVIENCSSGGHRLEPSMLGLTAMGSFSDAHETDSIPIIARNLHYLIQPRQSQIWAVLRQYDSIRRIGYSLAACFLGRMCLSGDIHELDEAQMELTRNAITLYRKAAPIIKDGFSHFHGDSGKSYRDPSGWQAVVREGRGEALGRLLIVVHGFAEVPSAQCCLPLPKGSWAITDSLGLLNVSMGQHHEEMTFTFTEDFSAGVILLHQ